jgi:hypothetical protein
MSIIIATTNDSFSSPGIIIATTNDCLITRRDWYLQDD